MSLNVVPAAGWDMPASAVWSGYAANGSSIAVADGGGGTVEWDSTTSDNDLFAAGGDTVTLVVKKAGIMLAAFEAFVTGNVYDGTYMEAHVKFPGNQSDVYVLPIHYSTYTTPTMMPVQAGSEITLAFFNHSGESKTLTYWEADLRMLFLI